MDTRINVAEENRRRRRVNKLKRIIVRTVIVCILAPTFTSIALAIQLAGLKKEVQALRELTTKQVTVVNEDFANSNGVDGVIGETEPETEPETEAAIEPEIEKETTPSNNSLEGKRKVYLTFDDGPSDNTDEILDILASYNVKGTFFVVAKHDEESLRVYKRIVDEGHTLAMHSYTHVYSKIYENFDNYQDDVLSLQNFLYENTGYKPVFYRFPGGSSNTVMNFDINQCINFLNDNGITYYDWNVSSGDATGNGYPANVLVENVINGTKDLDNAVVLMHDANSKVATVQALPHIIENFIEMGDVAMLPISENSIPVQHTKR